MHILLTGSSSNVGSGVLLHLLASGHNVTALDIIPLPASIRSQLPADTLDRLTTHILDLTDYHALERIFDSATFDGVIHLCAIPHPKGSDPRLVHNNNIVTSYNVLCTAAMRGVRRIVQASSVNAIGLSYTPEGHQRFDALPLTEEAPFREEDPYALSKHICELQAAQICRADPTIRIASLRFHMVKPSYDLSWPAVEPPSLYSWVALSSSARACLLGLTSEGWSGAEAFNIVAPEICWEGGFLHDDVRKEGDPERVGGKVGTLELLERNWEGRYDEKRLDRGWWEGRPRRAIWDCAKAERMLGWRHDL